MSELKRTLLMLVAFCLIWSNATQAAWGISTWTELRQTIENTSATDIVITSNITREAGEDVGGRHQIDISRALTIRSGPGGVCIR